MGKTNLTKKLEYMLYERLDFRKDFGCHEVTLGWFGSERVDFMVYTGSREVVCFEIKVSKADFNSKSKVSFVGHRNYYVMPKELFDVVKDSIAEDVGCYVPLGSRLVCIKKCKKRYLLNMSIEVILSSLLRSMQREWLKSIGGNGSKNWAEKTIGKFSEISGIDKPINIIQTLEI